ncbi:MAG: 6-phosphofructokinase [Oscillospiraceae bacterium]|jgi:6-phosphofructokinase 1|nr:6-phosphofructokinase [Oscillospiraceae bacterium]
MKRRIGLLTSGGDCPGLNAAIRGVARAAYEMFETEIVGIADGYRGLIQGDYRVVERHEFSGILTLGGTILGTSRQPFSQMRVVGEDNLDKVAAMKENYRKMGLDCLVTLGGNGTHKTANLLCGEGLNVIGLPKTIDNDIYGTDVTFGFHTAVDIATEVIDRLHTTAASHGRCMVIEMMGNKAGWLTLYAGLAGGADVILLPEIPYDMEAVVAKVAERAQNKKHFSIIAVAEGALCKVEAAMKKKDRLRYREDQHFVTVSQRIAADLQAALGVETRVVIPGHVQRGGAPSAYDRVLATRFGVHAAELIRDECYGASVAMLGDTVGHNPLGEVAGKTKLVPTAHQLVGVARAMGISFGD